MMQIKLWPFFISIGFVSNETSGFTFIAVEIHKGQESGIWSLNIAMLDLFFAISVI